MKISYTKEFIKMLERLEKKTRSLFLKQEAILREDWRDNRFHLKKLKTKSVIFSIRVAHSHRALFYFRTFGEIVFFAIGHRKGIYK